MKRGIIMEQHRNYMIVLTRDGAFYKAIPIEGGKVGSEVAFKPFPIYKRSMLAFWGSDRIFLRFFIFISIILLFVFPFYFAVEKHKTFAYVGIDINPSIEFGVNEDFSVQSIRTINDEAELVVAELSEYKNKQLKEVVQMFIDKTEETGLINNKRQMLVGVSLLENADNRIVDNMMKDLPVKQSEWEIAMFYVPKEIREKAEASEMSMNELMATTLLEETTIPAEESKLDEKDKAIIQSFYSL
ncbi:MAG: anti-sigma factor domain-containing protein [Virgibacillus proomii]